MKLLEINREKIIKLHTLDGLSVVNIAKIMGCSYGAVYNFFTKHKISRLSVREMNDIRLDISANQEAEIIDKYNNYHSMSDLTKQYNLTIHNIRNILRKNNVIIRNKKGPIPQVIVQNLGGVIVDDYNRGLSQTALIKKYQMGEPTLLSILNENKIKIRTNFEHTINENYFNKIDSLMKGYFIGWIISDGGLGKNRSKDKSAGRLSISIQERDGYVLEQFRQELNFSKPLLLRKKHGNRQDQLWLSVCNRQICLDLEKIGLTTNKSFTVEWPSIKCSDELEKHIILGIFDGDGGCSYTKQLCKTVQKTYLKFYAAIIGSISCMKTIRDILARNGIYSSYREIKKQNGVLGHIKIASKENFIKFYHYLYDDCQVTHLERKKNKFEEIMSILEENGGTRMKD